jgi:acyl-CoA hydrolase
MEIPSHQLSMTVLMTPDMANFAGNVHGGTILKLLDQVAYACASRYAARYVVTMSVDQVVFASRFMSESSSRFLPPSITPAHPPWRSASKVVAEDIRTQEQRHVNSCYFTMVAVDDDRRPVPVPPLRPTDGDEQRRFDEAVLRKRLRQELATERARIVISGAASSR